MAAFTLSGLAQQGAGVMPKLGVSPQVGNQSAPVSDTLNTVGVGGGDLYEALGALTEFAAPEIGRAMQDQAGSMRDWFTHNLSPSAQQSLQKEFFSLGPNSALRDKQAIWLNVVRQVPNILTLAVPGGAAAKTAQALGMTARAARGAAIAVDAMAGGALGGGQGAAEAANALEAAGITDPEARAAARTTAGLGGFVTGAISGPLEAGLLRGAATRGVSSSAAKAAAQASNRGLVKRLAVAGGKGAAINAAEETGQQFFIEKGKEQAGLAFDWSALPEAAASAAVTGVVSQAGARVVGTAIRPFSKEARANRKAIADAKAAAAALANLPAPPAPPANAPPPAPPKPAPKAVYTPPIQLALLPGVGAEFSQRAIVAQDVARRENALAQGKPPPPALVDPDATAPGVREHMTPMSPALTKWHKAAETAAAKQAAKERAGAPKTPSDLSGTPLGEVEAQANTDAAIKAKDDQAAIDFMNATGRLPGDPERAAEQYRAWKKAQDDAKAEAVKLSEAQAAEQAKEKAKLDELEAAEQARKTSVPPTRKQKTTGQIQPAVASQDATQPKGKAEPRKGASQPADGGAVSSAQTAAPAPVTAPAPPTASATDLAERARQALQGYPGGGMTSFLQRQLGVGYNQAAGLVQQLEDEGFVSPAHPTSGQRTVTGPTPAGDSPVVAANATGETPPTEVINVPGKKRRANKKALAEAKAAIEPSAPGVAAAAELPPEDPRVDPEAEKVVPKTGAAAPKRVFRINPKTGKMTQTSGPRTRRAKPVEVTNSPDVGNQPELPGTDTPQPAATPAQANEDGSQPIVTAQGDATTTLPTVEQPSEGSPLREVNAALGEMFRIIREQFQHGVMLGRLVNEGLYKRFTPEEAKKWKRFLERLMKDPAVQRVVVKVGEIDRSDPRLADKAAFYDPATNTIFIDELWVAPDHRLHVLAHEIAHAGTERFLRSDSTAARNAINTLAALKKRIGDAFTTKAAYTAKWVKRPDIAQAFEAYARSIYNATPSEFVATVLSDPDFAKHMMEVKEAKVGTLWPKFIDWINGVFGTSGVSTNPDTGENLMDDLLANARHYNARVGDDTVLTASKQDANVGPAGWNVYASLTAMGQALHPYTAVVGATSMANGSPAQGVLGIKDRLKQAIFYDALSTDHLMELYGDGIGAVTNGIAKQALGLYIANNEAMAHTSKLLTEPAITAATRYEELVANDPTQANLLLAVIDEASNYQLDPNLALGDPRNQVGSLRPAAAKRYAELQRKWQIMSPEAQSLFNELRGVAETSYQNTTDAFIKSILTQHYREVDPVSGAKREVSLTKAEQDAATIYSRITDSTQFAQLPGVKEKMAKQLARLYDSAKTPGPYFPAMRPHPWFVIGGDATWTKTTYTEDQWNNLDDPALNVQPGSIRRNADGTITAKTRRYWVETSPTEAQAYALGAQLNKQHGFPTHVKSRDEYRGSAALVADAAELDQLLETATKGVDPAVRQAVRDNLIDLFATRAAEGTSIRARTHREFVGGASKAFVEAVALQSAMAARQIARMTFDPRRQEARKILMDQFDVVVKSDNRTANHIRHIVATLDKRNQLIEAMANDRKLGNDLMSRVTNFTATMFLTSPMTVFTNGLQPWVVAMPVLAGKHGAGRASAKLMSVMRETGGGLGSQLKTSWARTAVGRRTLEPGSTLHDRMLKGISGLRLAMIKTLIANNRIDFTSTDDLMQLTDPTREGKSRNKWQQLQEFLFVAPRLVETFNRVNTALAAYDLAVEDNMPHDAAVAYADRVVRQTQFNYEQHNKSVLFLRPSLRAALVFKQYAYNMTMLVMREGYLAMNGDPQQKTESRVTLGMLGAVLFAGAGLAGATPEPLWLAFRAACALLGLDQPELTIRKGVEAVTGSTALGVMAAKGPLSYALGTDLQRLGIGNMILPRDLFDGETWSDYGIALMMGMVGAPGSLVNSTLEGMDRMLKGDVVGGLGQAMPLRIVANPIIAGHWLVNGMTDSTGKTILTPEEIGLWAAGQKAFGASPMNVAEVQGMRRQSYLAEKQATEAKGDIYRRWADAMEARDRPTLAALRAEIRQHNLDNPDQRITGRQLEATVRERRRTERQLLKYKAPVANKAAERRVTELSRYYDVPGNSP